MIDLQDIVTEGVNLDGQGTNVTRCARKTFMDPDVLLSVAPVKTKKHATTSMVHVPMGVMTGCMEKNAKENVC